MGRVNVDDGGGNAGIICRCVGDVWDDSSTCCVSGCALSAFLTSFSIPSSAAISAAREISRWINDAHAARSAPHIMKNTRTRKVRRIRLSTADFERIGASDRVSLTGRGLSAAMPTTSAGEEKDLLGVDRPMGCWVGGNRKDLVDQVFTRFRDASDVPSSCKDREPPSVKNEVRSSEGVDGGARGEANTSNWRER